MGWDDWLFPCRRRARRAQEGMPSRVEKWLRGVDGMDMDRYWTRGSYVLHP